MPEYILGVDGGQTSTKVVLATLDGQVVWYAQVASAFSNLDGDFSHSLERRLREILEDALITEAWETTTFEMAVLGMSGAEPGSPLIKAFERAAEGAVRARCYRVVHDAVTNLLGASAGQSGIVVIAGGGAVAYGFTEASRSWAAGGWGYAVGDEGSGYNIGRAAINSVFRALDGRDPPTQMVDPILRYFQASDPVGLKYAILGGEIRFQDIAGLPPLVARIAARGDATAQGLLQEAGQHLAEAAVAVARALDMQSTPMKVYFTGGLLHETCYVVPSFQAAVRQALPQALFPQPAFEPVVGTLFLAWRELGRQIDGPLLARLSESWKANQGDES